MALNPQVKHIDLMSRIQPSMRWQEGEDVAAWQAKARAKLQELLGLPLEKPEADNFRIEWTKEEATHTEIRFLFESEPMVDVLCHLCIPKGAEGKLPMVICLQGHSKGMHISLGHPKYEGDEETMNGGDRDFARQIIARGQAALAIEQRAFGEAGGTPSPACEQPAVQAIMLGRTLVGERCWDISRAIDAVEAYFPMIDMNKIALMGNSGGGTATTYAAALDTRIAAAMPSCAVAGYQASIGEIRHCICNYVPSIMKYFDMGDLLALTAPRAMIVVNGQEDDIFPIESAKKQVEIGSRVYRALGVGQLIQHVIGAEGHRFYAADSWPVFDEATGWKKEN